MKINTTKKYLMKRRRYGWGWTPVTWQGWLLTCSQVAIIFTAATFLPAKPAKPTLSELVAFMAILILAVTTIILFGLISSPKPAWRWGKKTDDNPEEDF